MNQRQMQTRANQRVLDRCAAFNELVQHPTNPMTRADLEGLIARHPERYGVFAGWLDKLPTGALKGFAAQAAGGRREPAVKTGGESPALSVGRGA